MDQRIINLFDEYTHKPLRRDEFLKRLADLTGSVAAAMAVLPLLEVNYAQARTVADQDDRIKTGSITFPGADTTMKGYAARTGQARQRQDSSLRRRVEKGGNQLRTIQLRGSAARVP